MNVQKPPWWNEYATTAPRSLWKRSGEKPGKQPGDPDRHLEQCANRDATKVHPSTMCLKCVIHPGDAEVAGRIVGQVFDLPPVALFCTEHEAERKCCRCAAKTTGMFSLEATASSSDELAPRVHMCYLVTCQEMLVGWVCGLLPDIYGTPVAAGTIVAVVKEGAVMLEEFLARVKDLLIVLDVACADQIGLRVEVHLQWVHAVSTTDLTLYLLAAERGIGAMDAMDVMVVMVVFEHLCGVLVRDGWASYGIYENRIHGVCHVHHLRELDAAGASDGQGWANNGAGFLSNMWLMVLEIKAVARHMLGRDHLAGIRTKYDAIIAAAYVTNLPVAPSGNRGVPSGARLTNYCLVLTTTPRTCFVVPLVEPSHSTRM